MIDWVFVKKGRVKVYLPALASVSGTGKKMKYRFQPNKIFKLELLI